MTIKKWLITAVAFLVLFGQAQPLKAGLFGPGDKEVLAKRAQKYWNSKLTGDAITCYQLEEPAYQKKVPLSVYAKPGNLVFKDVKVDQINISDDNATVTVKINYIIPALGSKLVFPSTVKDKWKKIDGKWYHLHQPKDLINGHKINQEERR